MIKYEVTTDLLKIFLSFTQSFSDLTEKLLVGEKFGDLDLRIFV